MKKTNIFWLLFFIILITLAIIWAVSIDRPEEVELDYSEVVREYVKENISDLSPEPEVLGGTFYVTNIDFWGDNLILVEYEDGHIALEAEAKYSIINGQVIIDYFQLTEPRDNDLSYSEKQDLVYSYIEEFISDLSPEPEVLGGTFYVTNLDFIDDNLAMVEYEDGHIALEAQAIYSIVDGKVVINSFQLIEREDEIIESLDENDLVVSYIEENISSLSPEPEVLGGTFYVTNLDFIDDNLVMVEYEDGHIALEALVSFSIEGEEVLIESFDLID